MRIKKGSQVEVLNEKKVLVSWHSAEILSGNGRTYFVRCDHQPVLDSGFLMERVFQKGSEAQQRKSWRPKNGYKMHAVLSRFLTYEFDLRRLQYLWDDKEYKLLAMAAPEVSAYGSQLGLNLLKKV